MTGYLDAIEKLTLENEHFRKVLHTTQHQQLVVMSLKPLEDIGVETHEIVDQFFRVEAGEGKLVLSGKEQAIAAGDAIIVPANTEHNIANTSANVALKLYTIYSPPHHKDGTVHATKQDAQKDTEDHL